MRCYTSKYSDIALAIEDGLSFVGRGLFAIADAIAASKNLETKPYQLSAEWHGERQSREER